MKVLLVDREKHMLEHFRPREVYCGWTTLQIWTLEVLLDSSPTPSYHSPQLCFLLYLTGWKIHPILTYQSLTVCIQECFSCSVLEMNQYHKLLEAFIYRTFILLLHRGMETVKKGIAGKGGNPKVRQRREELDSILAFMTEQIGRSLILGFFHMIRNSTLFYRCPAWGIKMWLTA